MTPTAQWKAGTHYCVPVDAACAVAAQCCNGTAVVDSDPAGRALCVLHSKQSVVTGTVEVEQRPSRVDCALCAPLEAKRRRGNGGGRAATQPGGRHSPLKVKRQGGEESLRYGQRALLPYVHASVRERDQVALVQVALVCSTQSKRRNRNSSGRAWSARRVAGSTAAPHES